MTTFQAQPVHIYTQHDRMTLTFATQQCMLHNKETHEIGDGKTDHLCTGMDTARTGKEERYAVSLRWPQTQNRAKRNGVAIYCSTIQAGNNDRAGDTSETQQIGDSPKNDFDPSPGSIGLDGP